MIKGTPKMVASTYIKIYRGVVHGSSWPHVRGAERLILDKDSLTGRYRTVCTEYGDIIMSVEVKVTRTVEREPVYERVQRGFWWWKWEDKVLVEPGYNEEVTFTGWIDEQCIDFSMYYEEQVEICECTSGS